MPALRVAYDATASIQGRTGIARYVEQLGGVLEQAGVDVRRYAVGRGPFPAPTGTHRLPVPLRVVARSWAAGGPPAIDRLTGRVDVVHATGLVVPRARRPIVLTVHDTAPLDQPDLHPARTVRQFEELRRALDRVAVVIAVSGSVREDLERHGVDPERVLVVHQGRTELPAPLPVPVGGPFLLAVGEQVPRKDHATLVRAFHEAGLEGVQLALAGRPAEATPELQELVGGLGLRDRVRFLGPVGDAELAWLYREALAFCYPSRGEGFGMPLIEAMAAGTPVVASAIPTTIEVAGDAALLHDAGDVAGCAERLRRVAGDAGVRAGLVAAGRERAARFTWERTAAGTVAAYERALGAGGRLS